MALLEKCARNSSGKCEKHGAGGGMVRQRGDLKEPCCSIYFGQARTARPCIGCEGLVPQHEIWCVNAECVEALQRGLMEPPYIRRSGFQETLRLGSEPYPALNAVICEACVKKADQFVNAGSGCGLIKFRDSARHLPLFSKRQEPKPVQQDATPKRMTPSEARLDLLRAIRAGEYVRFAPKSGERAQCLVAAHLQYACACGGNGWHNQSDMIALVRWRHERRDVFGLGPACAEAMRKDRPGVQFNGNFAEELKAALEGRDQTKLEPVNTDSWGGHGVVPVAGEEPRPSKPRRSVPARGEPEATPSSKSDQELDDYASWQPASPTERSRMLPAGTNRPKPWKRIGKTAAERAKKRNGASAPQAEDDEGSAKKPPSRAERKRRAASAG